MQFWNATRLRAEIARWPGDSTLRDRLAFVLGRGCGQRPGTIVRGGRPMQARTTPSAGALYPFEVLVSIRESTGFATYVFDVESNRISRLVAGRPANEVDFTDEAGLAVAPGSRLVGVVTLVARPWLAMVKYGQRGYLYTLLDIGHAASNVALAAAAVGLVGRAHLRFRRQSLATTLGLTAPGREPQIVVTLTEPTGSKAGQPAGDPTSLPTWQDRQYAALEKASPAEESSWQLLHEVSALYEPAASTAAPGRCSSIVESYDIEERAIQLPKPPHGNDDFGAIALRRWSAKGFQPGSLSLAELGSLFTGVTGPLETDCAEGGFGVAARILVRGVAELEPGAYAYSPGQHALRPLAGRDEAIDDDEVLASFMGQAGLRHAAVLIHLHASLRPLLRERGRAGLAEIHFHAAHVAQRLCLNGARYGVGITCVGGFDEVRCAGLVGLPAEDEVIYLLAAGVPDETIAKSDRTAIAHSHGRTTTEQR